MLGKDKYFKAVSPITYFFQVGPDSESPHDSRPCKNQIHKVRIKPSKHEPFGEYLISKS
jgi:hypothetical protein